MNLSQYIKPGFIAKSDLERAAFREWIKENPYARVAYWGDGLPRTIAEVPLNLGCYSHRTYEVLAEEEIVLPPGFVADTPEKKRKLKKWCEKRQSAMVEYGGYSEPAFSLAFDSIRYSYILLPDWFNLPDGWIARTDEDRIRLKDWCLLNPKRKVRMEASGLVFGARNLDPTDGSFAENSWIILAKDPEVGPGFVADTQEKFEILKKWSEENPFVPIQQTVPGTAWLGMQVTLREFGYSGRHLFRPYFEKIYRYSRPGKPDIYSTVDYSGPLMTSKTCIN